MMRPHRQASTRHPDCAMHAGDEGAHLFTETQVGKAMPFSMVFPLKTLATALQEGQTFLSFFAAALAFCSSACSRGRTLR
jgi:hypothetical protein